MQSKAFMENLEIGRLSRNSMPFIFKVQAVNAIGAGVPSKISDPIDLEPSLTVTASDAMEISATFSGYMVIIRTSIIDTVRS